MERKFRSHLYSLAACRKKFSVLESSHLNGLTYLLHQHETLCVRNDLGSIQSLLQILEELLRPHDCEVLAERLIHLGVPCGPVRDVPEAVNSAHARHRGMVVESGAYKGMGWPIKLSRTPARLRHPPPRLGEHTDAVLGVKAKVPEPS